MREAVLNVLAVLAVLPWGKASYSFEMAVEMALIGKPGLAGNLWN